MGVIRETTKEEALKSINELQKDHGIPKSKSIKWISAFAVLFTTTIKVLLWTVIYFILSLFFSSVTWVGVMLFGFVISYLNVKFKYTRAEIIKELEVD
jgi:fatty acid desaturase